MFLLLKHNGGHWAFPKGHVENDETEVETAIREIKEETNLDVEVDTKFRYVVNYSPKPEVTKDVVYFLAEMKGGLARPQLIEIQKLKWVTALEALDIITFENDKKVFLRAMDYLKGLN